MDDRIIPDQVGGRRPGMTSAFRGARLGIASPAPQRPVIPRHRVGATRRPMTGSSGGSSTPRLLASITSVSGILDRPLSRAMTARSVARGLNTAPASPQILAVDHRHRHGVEIEIIQEPRIDADARILEIGLAGRP